MHAPTHPQAARARKERREAARRARMLAVVNASLTQPYPRKPYRDEDGRFRPAPRPLSLA